MGSGHVFVVLKAHVRVFTPIIGCHSKANLHETSKMVTLVEAKHISNIALLDGEC